MASCDACGKSENMPYQCHHCGGTYCSEHRLPEAHDCPGLENWGDPDGVFDSGFDASVDRGDSGGLTDRFSVDAGPGGVLGYFRGNVTYVFLGLMWITFLLQHLALAVGGRGLHAMLFVLQPQHPLWVWTWVTSIFAHAPFSFMHIAGNSIVIFFFGRIVERYLGSRRFAAFFVATGVLAGLGQMGLAYAQMWVLGQGLGAGALGASGAGLAIMGFVTVVNPDLRVYLWFLIPVPVWVITIFYFGTSLVGITGAGGALVGGGVAHMAHLTGLLAGSIYAFTVRGERSAPDQLEFGGGGRRRGPGGRGPF